MAPAVDFDREGSSASNLPGGEVIEELNLEEIGGVEESFQKIVAEGGALQLVQAVEAVEGLAQQDLLFVPQLTFANPSSSAAMESKVNLDTRPSAFVDHVEMVHESFHQRTRGHEHDERTPASQLKFGNPTRIVDFETGTSFNHGNMNGLAVRPEEEAVRAPLHRFPVVGELPQNEELVPVTQQTFTNPAEMGRPEAADPTQPDILMLDHQSQARTQRSNYIPDIQGHRPFYPYYPAATQLVFPYSGGLNFAPNHSTFNTNGNTFIEADANYSSGFNFANNDSCVHLENQQDDVDDQVVPEIELNGSAANSVSRTEAMMLQIVRHIIDPVDRLHFELTCRGFYEYSRKTSWELPVEKDHLQIGFFAQPVFNLIMFRVGTVRCKAEFLTSDSRLHQLETFGQLALIRQPESFHDAFETVARRFKHNGLARITLGGYDKTFCRDGPPPTLLITKDVFVAIDKHFKYLRRISIHHCHLDDSAMHYLMSGKCRFPDYLEECTLDSVVFDRPEAAAELSKLITRQVKRFHIKGFTMEDVEQIMVSKAEEEKYHFEIISVEVSDSPNLGHGLAFFHRCDRLCDKLRIGVVDPPDGRRTMDIFKLVRRSYNMRHISSLHITANIWPGYSHYEFSQALQNIAYFTSVTEMTLKGWWDQELVRDVVQGLKGCVFLQSLTIMEARWGQTLLRLSTVLPKSLIELNFHEVAFSLKLIDNLRERLPRVKKLLIGRPRNALNYHDVLYIARVLRTLTSLRIWCRLSSCEAESVIVNHERFEEFGFVAEANDLREMKEMMQLYFKDVRCRMDDMFFWVEGTCRTKPYVPYEEVDLSF